MNAGLDLEMPAPLVHRGERLLEALRSGLVTDKVLNDRARKIIELLLKTERFQKPEDRPERYQINPARDEFIARASAEGIVLLKNQNNVLPLRKGARVAVIGQHASLPAVCGGGSARVPVDHLVTPLQAFATAQIDFTYELGVPVYGAVPVPTLGLLSPASSTEAPGTTPKPVRIEWFNGSKIGDNLVKDDTVDKSEYMIKERWPKFLSKDYCTRMTFDLTPETSGDHIFSVVTTGTATLYVDDAEVYHREQEPVLHRESFYFFRPKIERLVSCKMRAGRRYTITLKSWAAPPHIAKGSIGGEVTQGSAVGFLEYVDIPVRIQRSAQAAKTADVAIVFTGMTPDLESEGFDRPTMDLMPQEYNLIRAVAAANPRTVIVNTSGAPVSLHQIYDQVSGIIQLWFAGQEVGTSLTRILTGEVNPSGHLPMTWPRHIEDTPSHPNWPGNSDDIIRYEEGIFLGYRHYDQQINVKPLFPFGFGLSYTTFGNVKLHVQEPGILSLESDLKVSCSVTNTGSVAGKVVLQVYIKTASTIGAGTDTSSLSRPIKELKGFRKVFLEPGHSSEVEHSLDKYAVSYYDTECSCWRADKGTYEALVGFSAEEIVASAQFQVSSGFTWNGL